MMTNKFCPRCDTEKPIEDWGRNASRPDGFNSWCKACTSNYHSARNNTPEGKLRKRRSYLKKKYGLTPADIPDECELCGSPDRICVDHDHVTGEVRGFLCHKCNCALGQVNDDVKILGLLIEYLEKHNERS